MVAESDICIEISTKQTNSKMPPFHFRYWLSAPFIKQQVGKVKKLSVRKNIRESNYISLSELIIYEDHTFESFEAEGTFTHEQILEMTKNRYMVPKKTHVLSGILQR